MSDLRSELERLGERVRPASDAFERLERRRRRAERNRRIAAGTVALLVAIAGSVTAFAVFRDTEARVAGEGGAESFRAIWPESSYEEALAVQEAVDAGDQRSLAWRRSRGRDRALRSRPDALGWDADRRLACDGPLDRRFRRSSFAPTAHVFVASGDRLRTRERRSSSGSPTVAPDGIWTIVSARSGSFAESYVGEPTSSPGAICGSRRGSTPDTNVYVAFVGVGACAGWESDLLATAGPQVAIVVPELSDVHADGCDAVLIVLQGGETSLGASGLGQPAARVRPSNDGRGGRARPADPAHPADGGAGTGRRDVHDATGRARRSTRTRSERSPTVSTSTSSTRRTSRSCSRSGSPRR